MMKTIISYIIGMTLCLGIILVAVGCSGDGGQDPIEKPDVPKPNPEPGVQEPDVPDPGVKEEGMTVRFLLGARAFEGLYGSATRALPANYVTYESLNPHVDISHVQIQAYFTKDITKADNTISPEVSSSGIFTFREEMVNGLPKYSWGSTIPSIKPDVYFLYGFMPAEEASTVSIEPYKGEYQDAMYQNGAILTINGLNAVTPGDVCVIVGVKKADNNTQSIEDVGIQLGNFKYDCSSQTGNNSESYVYLLLDHLYAGLHFRFSIDSEYAKLRTIKLKSMTVKAVGDVATVKAIVNLVANNTGASPVGPVQFEKVSGGESLPAALYEGDERVLTTTPQDYLACFAPATNTSFLLETVYNVYDTAGNLIREDCYAANKITAKEGLTSGQIHTINVVVRPTYIYVLSDPDLDNPSMVVN